VFIIIKNKTQLDLRPKCAWKEYDTVWREKVVHRKSTPLQILKHSLFYSLSHFVPSHDCFPNCFVTLSPLCFGFLVIEINTKQCYWITIKPSMKPTWECRQGGKKKHGQLFTKKKTCANKCVIWNPSLLNTWHVKTVSIIWVYLVDFFFLHHPPFSVSPAKSRLSFQKQTSKCAYCH
jgi:hypothetical protein